MSQLPLIKKILTSLLLAAGLLTPALAQDQPLAAIQPEITIPDTWEVLSIPEEIPKENTRGLLKGGASEDGTKGAVLSILPINAEKFAEMKNPLEDLGWVIKEGDRRSGFKTENERDVQTKLGTARIVVSTNEEGTLETWILLHGRTGVFVKLFLKGTGQKPSQDPELKKVLQSLRMPALETPSEP